MKPINSKEGENVSSLANMKLEVADTLYGGQGYAVQGFGGHNRRGSRGHGGFRGRSNFQQNQLKNPNPGSSQIT